MAREKRGGQNSLYELLRAKRAAFDEGRVAALFRQVDQDRVVRLSSELASFVSEKLLNSAESREVLSDYRTNPYVLMTSASIMQLSDMHRFADFIFNNKLYAGLETSYGKLVEDAVVGHYPLRSDGDRRWVNPPEKVSEFATYEGLPRQEKAAKRNASVWREIDRSCVSDNRRYLVSIKSGPNTINDTQVQGMVDAISNHHREWLRQSKEAYPQVTELDIIIGLTYGTDRSTNNKENQILAKLLTQGFVEELQPTEVGPLYAEEHTPEGKPGVLIDEETRTIRVYRSIGQDFWAMIGDPDDPRQAEFVFLEVLLSLAKALSDGVSDDVEERVNTKIRQLSEALATIRFPRQSLPEWVREDFSEDELVWLATAMTSFFDEGI